MWRPSTRDKEDPSEPAGAPEPEVILPPLATLQPLVAPPAAPRSAPRAPIFDKQEQLEKIQAALLPGEEVEAVFDLKGGATGFLGITTHRVIVYDKTFLRKMKAVVSIPYGRIHTLAAEDESGLLTGRGFFASSKFVLTTSQESYELEFRGADKAHQAHNLVLSHLL